MKKVTKKDLTERLLLVETLLGLHRVLPEQISNEQANNAIFRMQCALSSGKDLAERDIAKELLEVDLSSELTGSDLCRAMLGNGLEYVMCLVGDECEESASNSEVVRVICSRGADYFDDTTEDMWYFAIPINNQGEPLTASEVGL